MLTSGRIARQLTIDMPCRTGCGPRRSACCRPAEPRLVLCLRALLASLLILGALPAIPQTLTPVTESFNTRAVLQTWRPFSGTWEIVEGAYRETSEDYRTVTLRAGRLYDFDLLVKLKYLHIKHQYPLAGYAVVILRAQDSGHYYAVIARQNGALELAEYTSRPSAKRPVWQQIAAAGGELPERELYVWHIIQVQCRGLQIAVSMFPAGEEPPEEPLLKANLGKGEFDHSGGKAYLSGRIGFGSSHATIGFDDLSIQPKRAAAELVDRLAAPRELVRQTERHAKREAREILSEIDKLRRSFGKIKPDDDDAWRQAEERLAAVVVRAKETRKKALLAQGGFLAVSPYVNLARFRVYKGNLHAYTLHSNGGLYAEDAAARYREAGYDFVAFTDHDAYGDQDGGMLFPRHQNDREAHDWNGDGVLHEKQVYRSGLEAYVRDYSRPSPSWVDQNWNLNRPGSFLVVNARGASFGHPRVGCIGHPPGDIARPRESYAFIDEVRRVNGLLVLHHPSGWNTAPELIDEDENLRTFDGLEVYNGAFAGRPTPANQDGHEGFSEPLWNACLDAGRHFWGFANDGTHSHDPNAFDRPFNGFNVVWASELTRTAILDALRSGRFYASCGIIVDSVRVTASSISVASKNAARIRVIGHGGAVIQVTDGSEMTYEMDGSERWIRIEFENDQPVLPGKTYHQRAWLQPVLVDKLLTVRT